MAFLLLWIESLAAMLLFVAMIMSLRRRQIKRWKLVALSVSSALPIFALAVGVCVGATFLSSVVQVLSKVWCLYVYLWTVAFAAGVAIIVTRGARPTGNDPSFVACGWPRVRLAMAFSAALALLAITFWDTDSAARAQLTSLRTEASTLALSVAPSRVPDRENAAIFYAKASETMMTQEDMPKEWQHKQSKWLHFKSDMIDKDLRDYLARHHATLYYLRKATSLPSCYFERNYGQPSFEIPFPELARIRHSARLLAMAARVRAADGDVKGAIEDVAAIFNLSAHINQNPMLIAHLVAMAIYQIGKGTLDGVLNATNPTANDLAILKLDDKRSFRHILQRTLICEEACGLSTFAILATQNQNANKYLLWQYSISCEPPLLLSLWRVFMMSDDLAVYRQMINKIQNLNSYSYYEVKSEWSALNTDTENKHGGIMTAQIAPTLLRCSISMNRADTSHRLMCVAVAASLYRLKVKKYPERLEDLVPDYIPVIPLSPFDGQPLKMMADGKGIILYGADSDNQSPQKKPFTDDDSWRIFRLGVAAPKDVKADF
ncbi:MAG: hypothetical protein V1899_03720 [Planctomycetota bacterium]